MGVLKEGCQKRYAARLIVDEDKVVKRRMVVACAAFSVWLALI